MAEMKDQYYDFMDESSKLMPEIHVPPEMAYTMQYMMPHHIGWRFNLTPEALEASGRLNS